MCYFQSVWEIAEFQRQIDNVRGIELAIHIDKISIILVGNGSRSQDLSWEERINFLTSSAVAGLNDVIGQLISGC